MGRVTLAEDVRNIVRHHGIILYSQEIQVLLAAAQQMEIMQASLEHLSTMSSFAREALDQCAAVGRTTRP